MPVIFQHVANGGSLIGLCETWDIRYSEVIAWVNADPARAESYKTAIAARSEWTDEMILAEIHATCRFDPRRLYYPEGHARAGKLIPMHELDAESARMIQQVDSDGRPKVYDKLKAIELAGRTRGSFKDRHELEVGSRLEDILAASNKPDNPALPAAIPGQLVAPQKSGEQASA